MTISNRMVSAGDGTNSATYQYDALGRRVKRTQSSDVQKYTHDGDDVVLDDINSTLTKYQNGLGVDDKQKSVSGGTSKYFLGDHLGSTAIIANSSGASIDSNSFDSFGNATNGSFTNRFQYTGREADPLTGQQFNRARFYDPTLGRFNSEDPIGLAGGINQYSYVSNGPVNKTDPSGLYEIDVHYYLTYYLAMKTGCFSHGQAVAIANGNQMTDEDPSTSPGYGRGLENSTYHGLNDNARPGVGATDLYPSTINYLSFGRFLHYYQDTFSHRDFASPTFGHATRGHFYDKTNSDVNRAMAMAQGTYYEMQKFAGKSGCQCNRPWSSDMNSTVDGFNRSPGADFGTFNAIDSTGGIYDFGITNPSGYLDNKIRFLGVPRR